MGLRQSGQSCGSRLRVWVFRFLFAFSAPPTLELAQHKTAETMAIHTIQLQNIPVAHEVHIVSFKDVENASFLREQLLGGNAEFEYAFVDASTVSHILSLA